MTGRKQEIRNGGAAERPLEGSLAPTAGLDAAAAAQEAFNDPYFDAHPPEPDTGWDGLGREDLLPG